MATAPTTPLDPTTAPALVAALLMTEGEARCRRFAEIVRADESFARWLAKRSEGPSRLLTPEALGEWLSQNAIDALAGVANGPLQTLLALLHRLRALEAGFQDRLEREKLAAMRELAYGASHEINNPLANIATRAQTLLREETDPVKRRTLATINAQAFRAFEMIADMMLFAKPPEPRLESVELFAIARTVLAELQAEADEQGTQLELIGDTASLAIMADATQLTVAVRAVCQNSLDALRSGGRVEVHVANSRLEGWVELIVSDTGPGISPQVRQHLFDPFFSGREAGRGLGLGLSKCWRVVELHGGRIVVDSQPGHGARFTLLFPIGGPASESASDEAPL